MTSIFEGQPPKTRPFPIKTKVIWVPGICIYVYILFDSESFGLIWSSDTRCISGVLSDASRCLVGWGAKRWKLPVGVER